MSFKEQTSPYEQLVQKIENATNAGVTIDDAERTAAAALGVMHTLSVELKAQDKERRMRKRGLKAIKSAVRLEELKKHDKKPTEGYLEDIVNSSKLVCTEEEAFDTSEVETDELHRQFDIAKEAHLYFRGISKGRFE